MNIDILFHELQLFMLVFARAGGVIFLNPLFARRNVPAQIRVALVFWLAVLITPMLTAGSNSGLSDFSLIVLLIKELTLGLVLAYVFQFFYYLLFTAGDIIDLGFGLSMAKAFDPSTSISSSMSGNLFQIVFILYFFVADCHLTFIKLIVSSFGIIEAGSLTFGPEVWAYVIDLFSGIFLLIMQITLPFAAATYILEISIGVLMKLIPQINVFVINFQFKVFLGIISLFLFAEPLTAFLFNYVEAMFETLSDTVRQFG